MAETIPGGYYIGTDGKPHNAEGKPVQVQTPAPAPAEPAPAPKK